MSQPSLEQARQKLAIFRHQPIQSFDILRQLLLAFDRSPSSVTQLIRGTLDQDSSDPTTRLQKNLIFFQLVSETKHLNSALKNLRHHPLTKIYQPQILFVTNNSDFIAQNFQGKIISDQIANLSNYAEFFYSLSGHDLPSENFSDTRAAERIKFLYDALRGENVDLFQDQTINFRHDLNLFFVRLLFCFFAEDTQLFPASSFTNLIANFSKPDGSDLNLVFTKLFQSLDSSDKDSIETPYQIFPYINGTLFKSAEPLQLPKFSARTRMLLLYAAEFDWSSIDPDIFGTIFQSFVDQDRRSETGMEYTSVANIEKVINPLFLDELNLEFENSKNNSEKLQQLWQRISSIKFFDPACGCGNFLIVAYRKLRLLEMQIIAELQKMSPDIEITSKITLDQFYGIELEDLPREITVLSLYIATHQMNLEFEKRFAEPLSLLPIIEIPTIICGNATRLDWQKVCPNSGNEEIYLFGNPPYKGAKKQLPSMKSDFQFYYSNKTYFRNLDYISLWFLKGADFISHTPAKLAFVTTNSVCQGEHAGQLFSQIYTKDVEIDFAREAFKWQNGASQGSVVTVVIIGLASKSQGLKRLYNSRSMQKVDCINPYLIPAENTLVVNKRLQPLAPDFPKMQLGSQLIDNGNLVFSESEYRDLISKYPEAKKFFSPLIGGSDFLRHKIRYCLYVDVKNYLLADQIPALHKRFEKVTAFRQKSSSRKLTRFPYRFMKDRHVDIPKLIIPRVSSELREYYPVGLVDAETIISDSALFIANPDLWLLAVLSSRLHFLWIRTVCGQFETRLRYSITQGFNTFPLPKLSMQSKKDLEKSASAILDVRHQFPQKSLADLYRPGATPTALQNAHQNNDKLVESLFTTKKFANDSERLAELFRYYQKML